MHARSIRLAAIRGDQLLEERTLPYDEEAVERALRRWPLVRCCYEAGPTGFGLQRFLVAKAKARDAHLLRAAAGRSFRSHMPVIVTSCSASRTSRSGIAASD